MEKKSGAKKFIALILFIHMILVMLPALAFADDQNGITTWTGLQGAINRAGNGDTVTLRS